MILLRLVTTPVISNPDSETDKSPATVTSDIPIDSTPAKVFVKAKRCNDILIIILYLQLQLWYHLFLYSSLFINISVVINQVSWCSARDTLVTLCTLLALDFFIHVTFPKPHMIQFSGL